MKSEWRVFGIVSLFLYIVCGLYAWWTNAEMGRVDWIGSVALFLAATLCLMCGAFFWFVSRRIEPRPEDRADAEISDGAGEVGFFSPGSYWPFGVALAATISGVGLVFSMWWLVAAGLIAVIAGAAAMIFEYYTGTRRPVEH